MSAEILAFNQAQAQAQQNLQTLQQVNNSVEANNNLQTGLFDSLIMSLTGQDEQTEPIIQDAQEILTLTENQEQTQIFTFSSNNSFSQSIINLLSDFNDDEIQPQAVNSQSENINGENITEALDVIFDAPENIDDVNTLVNNFSRKAHNLIDDVKNFLSNKLEAVQENFDAEDFISQILNDEDFSEKLNSLPDEKKQEILSVINEAVKILKNSGSSENKAKLVNLLENLSANFKNEKINADTEIEIDEDEGKDEKDDDEDLPEIDNDEINSSGLAGALVNFVSNNDNYAPENNNLTVKSHADNVQTQARNLQQETPEINAPSRNTSENAEANFSEVIEPAQNEQQETSGQNNNQDGNNFSQGRENFSASRTANSKNNTRKAEAKTDDENFSSTQRTQSHSNFQGFFENVLANRRTASRTSPMPLNLQSSGANFTPSTTLRDGLINVVRFIRADGVHKANVVIDPPALGRISVELTSGSSGVEASIKVASEQVRNLIQDQIEQLRMNLSQQGVQVAEFTVDVQQDNSGSQQQNSNSQGDNQSRRFIGISSEDEEPEEFRIDLEDGLLYWVA